MSLLTAKTNWPRGHDRVVFVLAAMLLLVPAVGVPSELLLQDTLKSALVAFSALGAALLLCRDQLREPRAVYWHPLLWLPLLLLAWALGSMAWSHTYLAAVEAVRWFVFALLLGLGLQVLQRSSLSMLANGVHWGAVVAALWAALQFWADLRLFPQAAMPGATFSNRNFLAEYLVCALPFSVWLAAQSQGTGQLVLRVFTLAFTLLALLMTGTRSALLALLALTPVLLLVLYLFRAQFVWPGWSRAQKALALAVFALTLLGLGSVPAGNAQLNREQPGQTALTRSLLRAQSLGQQSEYVAGSAGTRLAMWQSNARMVMAHPWSGVGAGAWEVQIPRYQSEGMTLEEDYYAHNEPLQLVAEYGLVGWLFLLALVVYLLQAAQRTWQLMGGSNEAEAPGRAIALASLLALFTVGLAGFPWHLAATGALFAICLSLLAASDRALAADAAPAWNVQAWGWRVTGILLLLGLLLATWITRQAWASESRLVRAAQMALNISASGRPDDPSWDSHKAEMLQLVREGVAIHPHYRKITPMVADELVRWGDWRNATWIWESVDASRPYIVVLMTNLGRAYGQAGDQARAWSYLERAQALQPRAVEVRSLQVALLLQTGQEDQALDITKASLAEGIYDYELLSQAYQMGIRRQDWPLAIEALTLRVRGWPATAVEGWLRLAQIHASPQVQDPARALQAYRAALQALPEEQRDSLRRQIPLPYRNRL